MNSGSLHTLRVRQASTIALAAGLLLGQSSFLTAAAASDTTVAMPPVAPPIKKASTPIPAAPAVPSSGTPASSPAKTPTVSTPQPPTQAKRPAAPAVSAQAAAARSSQVSELERLMFGEAKPNIPLEYRLDRLESEVFHSTNPDWDASKRIERLTQTLIGNGLPPASADPSMPDAALPAQLPYPPSAVAPPFYSMPYNQQTDPYGSPTGDYEQQAQQAAPQKRNLVMPPSPDLEAADFQKELPRLQAEQFALEQVNSLRSYNGLPALDWDDIAYKVAQQHVGDLCGRNTVSHNNAKGENPDVRYTKAGGSDAVLEGLISLKASGRVRLNKALVYKIVQELTTSQDDRDALLSAYATKFAFSFSNNSRADKLIAVTEVVTDMAEIAPIPSEIHVGDKIEIKGTIKGPLKFQKITVAWEGLNGNSSPETEEEQDEALPYFPPLDYTAFARKSEHDWEKATRLLQLGGIGLALAGGLFIPPVALAAPLIAASSNNMKVKPVSDIPVKGGVKVSGQAFEHKAVISKDNKEGIYYITVWAQSDSDPAPIAISRRAVIAKSADNNSVSTTDVEAKPREMLTVIDKENSVADKHKGEHETK